MKPLVLCILDGVGYTQQLKGNAFLQAKKPNFDFLLKNYPHSFLEASGEHVGLPSGQMGNSEVGHMNIGAGRIVYQPLQFISEQIKQGTFFQNIELLSVINHVKQNHSRLHLMGLLSNGGIHSTIDHLFALIDLCKQEKITDVYYHIYTDGRDTLTNISLTFIEQLTKKIKETNIGSIATIAGRYYAMDRDNRFDRVKKAYDAIVYGNGETYDTAEEVIQSNYERNLTDEFIIPAVINSNGIVQDNDGIIFFNYRPDRLRELASSLTNPNFEGFETKKINNLKLVTMMPISEESISTPAFQLKKLNDTFGEYISEQGFTQLRIAETEKYAHVTYFFDGGVEKELKGCKRILIPSPKVATYDLSPDMSSKTITDTLIDVLDQFDVVILNYANGDMLGHTGNLKATIQSIETLDQCLGTLYEKVNDLGGTLIVTADHGNCEYLLDEKEQVITSHTTNPVYFLITRQNLTLKDGKLGDIAPTMLDLLEVNIPLEMTGTSLIEKN